MSTGTNRNNGVILMCLEFSHSVNDRWLVFHLPNVFLYQCLSHVSLLITVI